mmetsp:Transcript_44671/g.145156  ORF Transcript_44671/g.145156 Transcript_44671/m.145156 type:complete len:207 (+) Transcript_44671:749-1369(+)
MRAVAARYCAPSKCTKIAQTPPASTQRCWLARRAPPPTQRASSSRSSRSVRCLKRSGWRQSVGPRCGALHVASALPCPPTAPSRAATSPPRGGCCAQPTGSTRTTSSPPSSSPRDCRRGRFSLKGRLESCALSLPLPPPPPPRWPPRLPLPQPPQRWRRARVLRQALTTPRDQRRWVSTASRVELSRRRLSRRRRLARRRRRGCRH